MTAPQRRPRVVTVAFWCWTAASVMLMVGGLIAASAGLPTAYRAAGVVTVATGAGMGFLAARIRGEDVRFRRAAVALALTIVVLIVLVATFGVLHLLTLLAVIPLIAGAVLITRPTAATQGEPS